MRKSAFAAALVAGLLVAGGANAATTLALSMDFESGASFTGDVTFEDDFSAVLDVDGILTGYEEGNFGYTGTGSSHVNFVWIGGFDFDPSPTGHLSYLMSGVDDANFGSFISFAYDISSGVPVLGPGADGGIDVGYFNNVNYEDAMVSGAFGAVPEPATWAMMIAGFGLAGASLRRRTLVSA